MSIPLMLNLLGIGLACAAILVLFTLAGRRAAQLETMELSQDLPQRYTLDQAA